MSEEEMLDFYTAFIDSFIVNEVLEDAMRLKWRRALILEGRPV